MRQACGGIRPTETTAHQARTEVRQEEGRKHWGAAELGARSKDLQRPDRQPTGWPCASPGLRAARNESSVERRSREGAAEPARAGEVQAADLAVDAVV